MPRISFCVGLADLMDSLDDMDDSADPPQVASDPHEWWRCLRRKLRRMDFECAASASPLQDAQSQLCIEDPI
jgi:hypothetical protein